MFPNKSLPLMDLLLLLSLPGLSLIGDCKCIVKIPRASLTRPTSLSTYGFVLALLGAGGYFTYLNFFPAPKKKTKVKPVATGPIDTPVTPGSGVYSEDWIPAHHLRKPKSKGGALSSGDESDARRRKRGN
jgi:hypothetical protein